MSKLSPILFVLTLSALCFNAQSFADEKCKIIDQSDAVIIMVCPPDLDKLAWQDAGVAACGSKKSCNVWIWEDKTKAPDKAPKTDAELPKNLSIHAVAVWVNDSLSLMTLKKTK